MIERFLRAMGRFVPEDGRIMACQFRGDPADDIAGKWRARVVDDVRVLDPDANVYLAVSAMRQNSRGEFRRRKENFAGGLLLMIDDLGDGPGSKFPLSTVTAAPPTALIETSPDNFQAIYMFDRLIEDRELFEALIHAFIAEQFIGNDPGMGGVNRVFRPPIGVNGKAKYGGWTVRGVMAPEERRYSIDYLVKAFGLTLNPPRPAVPRGATVNRADSIRAFVSARAALRSAGLLRSERENLEGWIDVNCPWAEGHTGTVDNGAAIRLPAEENAWTGAFRCHHGSCAERGWRELTEWLAEECAEVLELVNANAPDTWEDFE